MSLQDTCTRDYSLIISVSICMCIICNEKRGHLTKSNHFFLIKQSFLMATTSNLVFRRNKYYILQLSSFMKFFAKVAVYQAFKHEFFANFLSEMTLFVIPGHILPNKNL